MPEINFSGILPDTKFFRVMRESETWRAIANVFFTVRTWSRMTIWGDRVRKALDNYFSYTNVSQLFLQFHGPMTILLQTRAGRLRDVLTIRDINEIADAPAGALQSALTSLKNEENTSHSDQKAISIPVTNKPPHMSLASVGRNGKVKFELAEESPPTPR